MPITLYQMTELSSEVLDTDLNKDIAIPSFSNPSPKTMLCKSSYFVSSIRLPWIQVSLAERAAESINNSWVLKTLSITKVLLIALLQKYNTPNSIKVYITPKKKINFMFSKNFSFLTFNPSANIIGGRK